MERIMVQRRSLHTEYGRYHLVYELLKSSAKEEDGYRDYFGIRIIQRSEDGLIFDQEEVLGITEEETEAERLFCQYVCETVMPVHLTELIDDWNSNRFFAGMM